VVPIAKFKYGHLINIRMILILNKTLLPLKNLERRGYFGRSRSRWEDIKIDLRRYSMRVCGVLRIGTNGGLL
jgi:hypothetical protein